LQLLYKATIAIGKNQRVDSQRFSPALNGGKSSLNGILLHSMVRPARTFLTSEATLMNSRLLFARLREYYGQHPASYPSTGSRGISRGRLARRQWPAQQSATNGTAR
jgi:hypothetical protein